MQPSANGLIKFAGAITGKIYVAGNIF